MLKLVNPGPSSVHVLQMKDGDIAQIINWNNSGTQYIGRIVQRYNDTLLCLGCDYGASWPYLFRSDPNLIPACCTVMILPKSSQFILE